MSELHPWVAGAARGALPEWAVARKKRRAHMGRVAALLREWSEGRGDDSRDEMMEGWFDYRKKLDRPLDPSEAPPQN